ncbi:MAG TPA: YceI family protein [Streptosporangiaceae bacterium]|nr:YceI family protein [Streptosporangiaceae bacterium]
MARLRPRRLIGWLVGAAAAVVVLSVGGAFVYIHFISGPAPAPLSLHSSAPSAGTSGTAAASTTAALAGSWRVAAGSIVGYRVNEVLAGQNNVAVGRTDHISGSLTITGDSVTAASFTVQMATVRSDESERDVQFNGRIMDTSAYPTGTLTLTKPISLGSVPAVGVIRDYEAAGTLTLHGQTRAVRFALQAERTASVIEVSGSIPIVFADWGIGNPSFPPFVTTQNHGELEFLVKFSRA